MNETSISIIISIYNTAPYLRRCLDSVLAQTYRHFEVILVDDGSTDSSGEICDSYASKDSRFIVIHQANAGQSAGRNAGLSIARGQLVSFLDSDDYWDDDYLECLLDALHQYQAQAVFCQVKHVGFPNQKDSEQSNDDVCICSGDEMVRNVLLGINGFSASVKNALFDIDVLKQKRMLEGHVFEDLEYLVQIAENVTTAVALPVRKYNYCYRSDNSSSLPLERRIEDLKAVFAQIDAVLQEKYPCYILEADQRYIWNSLPFAQEAARSDKALFKTIRLDIMSRSFAPELQTPSARILYKALCRGRIPFLLADEAYSLFKKMRSR